VTTKSPRFETYPEAKAWEEAQRTTPLVKFVAEKKASFRGPVMTIGELFLKAQGVIWRGLPSEETNEAHLRIVIEMLGHDLPLRDLTTPVIDELIAKLLKGRKGATVNRYLSNIRRFMDWGRERGYIENLPTFDWQEEAQGRIRWITKDEEAQLYELLDERMGRLVHVAIRTGMRRGELLTLTYEQLQPTKVHLWKTKNKTGRTISISPTTHDNLMWLLDHGMPNEHELRWAWDQARAAMGLTDDPYFVFHVCRHTCATRLVEAGVNLRVIQKWLGHLTIETTIRYAQVKDTMLEDALTRLDELEQTQVDQVSAGSKRHLKVSQRGHYPVELLPVAVEKHEDNQCGRGGTGRRARFRLPSEDEEPEENQ
jgi:hypothetical protein